MEKLILLVNANKIYSKKKDEYYYLIEYVDLENNAVKTVVKNTKDFDENTFEKIKTKVKKQSVNEIVGIFKINGYDKVELSDIK